MNYYSQYGEDKIISKFFSHKTLGNVLDIGANDGKTISNSLHFIELGWGGTMVEASPTTFEKLKLLHTQNENVQCLNMCISDKDENFVFYHNLTHFRNGDSDLLSTISKDHFIYQEQFGYPFETFDIPCYQFKELESQLKYDTYDLISIDIEGYDYQVMKQIDLRKFNCQCLVIEYNGHLESKNGILSYCDDFGLSNVLHDNGTNIIITV